MGKAIGRATTLSGDEVVVTVNSAEIADDIELMLTSVSLQMDGGEGYEPSKITTASIGCLADGFALMRLCAASDAKVNIENKTSGKMLFVGHIVPNSLNQSVTGINDSITIECVDSVGFAQYVNYALLSPANGFQTVTLKNVIERIAKRIGIANVALPSTILISKEDGVTTSNIEFLTLSEAVFFSSEKPSPDAVTPEGYLSREPFASSCREALELISSSFRMTWVQRGDTLFLYDDVSSGVYYNLDTKVAVVQSRPYSIDEESFRTGECLVSTTAKTECVALSHTKEDEINVLPDAFDKNFLQTDVYEYKEYDDEEDDNKKVFAVYLKSKLYNAYIHTDSYADSCHFVAWNSVPFWKYSVGAGSANEVIVYDKNAAVYNEKWSVAIRVKSSPSNTKLKPLLELKPPYCHSVAKSGNMYLYPDIEFDVANSVIDIYPADVEKKDCYLWVAVKVGDLFYDIKSNSYTADEKRLLLTLHKDGRYTLGVDNASPMYYRQNIPITIDGSINFIIYGMAQDLRWEVGYIRKLNLLLRRGNALETAQPSVEFYGDMLAARRLEVSLPIDLYYTLGEKTFGTVIDGVDYREKGVVDIKIGGKTMVQRIYQQSNSSDGLIYTVNVDDKKNSVVAYDKFTSSLWSGEKKAVGIEQDVINNSIRVTLL